MSPYEYLTGVRRAAMSIEPLRSELATLEEAAARGGCFERHGSGGPHGRGTTSDPTARAAEERIDTLPGRIADARGRLAEAGRVVGDCLAMLADMGRELGEGHALAVELYWVDGASTWSEVAEEMGRPVSTVWRMRDLAYRWMGENL